VGRGAFSSTHFQKIQISVNRFSQTAYGSIADFAAELVSHRTREIRMYL
jgi:hypothetical protein